MELPELYSDLIFQLDIAELCHNFNDSQFKTLSDLYLTGVLKKRAQ